jgi:hypothetical protein
LRNHKIQNLSSFFGSGMWEGDLSAMREDRPVRPRASAKK